MQKARQQLIEHIRQSLTVNINEVRWIPSSGRLIAAGYFMRNTGCLQIYSLDAGKLEKTAEVEKPRAFHCITFDHSPVEQRNCATGTADGMLHTWDIENFSEPIFETKAHASVMNRMAGGLHAGPPEIATAGRDGFAKVWDVRQKGQPVAQIEPLEPSKARDCWCVALGNSCNASDRCLAAGYDNGDIKLMDLRANKILWETNTGNGVCSLDFDRPDIPMNKLYAATLEGRVSTYDLRTQHPSLGFAHVAEKVHTGTVWTVRSLPQNREVFVSCANGEVALMKYSYPSQRFLCDQEGRKKGIAGTLEVINKVTFSTQPITSWDWNHSKQGLAVCSSLDQSIRVILVTKLEAL